MVIGLVRMILGFGAVSRRLCRDPPNLMGESEGVVRGHSWRV